VLKKESPCDSKGGSLAQKSIGHRLRHSVQALPVFAGGETVQMESGPLRGLEGSLVESRATKPNSIHGASAAFGGGRN